MLGSITSAAACTQTSPQDHAHTRMWTDKKKNLALENDDTETEKEGEGVPTANLLLKGEMAHI